MANLVAFRVSDLTKPSVVSALEHAGWAVDGTKLVRKRRGHHTYHRAPVAVDTETTDKPWAILARSGADVFQEFAWELRICTTEQLNKLIEGVDVALLSTR